MNERERLEKLIYNFTENVSARELHSADFDKNFADYLLQNGVIVPPCKVGDRVYMLNRDKTKVQEMVFDKPDIRCHCTKDDEFSCCMPICNDYHNGICAYRFNNDFSEIGKTVFLTEEEAKKSLKDVQE